MAAFKDYLQYPVRSAQPESVVGSVRVTFGSGGTIAGVTGHPGVSCARAATGIYSLSFPPVSSGGDVRIQYGVEVGLTGYNVCGLDKFVLTGMSRFQIKVDGGTLANPLAGDHVTVFFYVDPSTVNFPVS